MLLTKLHRPPVTKEHVYKQILIDKLNENMHKPLTLVSAGAGYGKSMLISSWLEKELISYAWFSLSEEDNNLSDFIAGICMAIQKEFPQALKHLSRLLEASSLPELSILSESLLNGLDEIQGEFVLVLDDYHLINNVKINELISTLLQFPPQFMHLVLISRHDPFLDLGMLRSVGRICEIRMDDLCLKEDEIIVLFAKLLNIQISSKIALKLIEKTEGWITGLRLASLIIGYESNTNIAFENFSAKNEMSTEFLLKEVVLGQQKHIQKYLLQASILNRFSSELIEELCLADFKGLPKTPYTGKEIIQIFTKNNLFTISLDNERRWFRFHHLFQELLQAKLNEVHSAEEIDGFHLRAACWFDEKGFVQEAVEHALKGNNTKLALKFIKKHRYELMNTAQMYRLDKLIKLFPIALFENEPELLLAKSFICDYRGQLSKIFSFKDKAKEALKSSLIDADERNVMNGEIATLEGESFLFTGEPEKALMCSKIALNVLPFEAHHIRSYAAGIEVIYCQMSNNTNAISKVVFPNDKSSLFNMRMQLWYSISYAMEGDTVKLEESASKLLMYGKKQQFSESMMFGAYYKSVALFLSYEFEKAIPILKEVLDNPYATRPNYLAQSAFILASIYLDRNLPEKATEIMDFVMEHMRKNKEVVLIPIIEAMNVELALKEHNIEKAKTLNDEIEHYELMPILWLLYVPQLTPIKLKIAINTQESIKNAQEELNNLEVIIRKGNKKTILTDVLILQAVVFKKQSDTINAIKKIEEALTLSSVGNNIVSYVEFGSSLQSLFTALMPKSKFKLQLAIILKEIASKEVTRTRKDKTNIEQNTLVILTYRELEILKLVAKGLRNKEISDCLFVQPVTIKKHLNNIFKKLKVANRMMAVKKAKNSGLLS